MEWVDIIGGRRGTIEGRVEFVGSEGAIVSLTTELSANISDILTVCLKRSLKLHIFDLKAVVWDLL